MKTSEFITKAWNGETKAKQCSNVFSEGSGDKLAIYSYGYHYPLLFKVNRKAIRNVTGYSSSTGRHIMWSRGVEAIDIMAGYGFRLSYDENANLEELKKAQGQYIQKLKDLMAAKKRKDTAIYADLERLLQNAEKNLQALIS